MIQGMLLSAIKLFKALQVINISHDVETQNIYTINSWDASAVSGLGLTPIGIEGDLGPCTWLQSVITLMKVSPLLILVREASQQASPQPVI